MEHQDYNVQFLYGRTLRFADESSNDTLSSYTPSNILQTIAGDHTAQLNGPTNLRKPLILAMFGNYQNDAKEIISLLNSNNWGQYEQPGAEAVRAKLQALHLPTDFLIADI